MGGIKPIETRYRGYRFRSRLEARWAVFFDVAGIAWQYEPEGFDLTDVKVPRKYEPDLPPEIVDVLRELDHSPPRVWNEPEDMQAYAPLWYLPDFYLPEQEYWVEVKPTFPAEREVLLMRRLVMATGKDGYIFYDTTTPSEQIDDREERFPRFAGILRVGYERMPLSWSYQLPAVLSGSIRTLPRTILTPTYTCPIVATIGANVRVVVLWRSLFGVMRGS